MFDKKLITRAKIIIEDPSDSITYEEACNLAVSQNNTVDLIMCAGKIRANYKKNMALKLKEKGVTTYHHNLETAESYFNQICTTHDYDEDICTLKTAKSAGLKICSGGILGMGESWAQRVELAFTLKKLNVDSIPVNFLNPIPGTRMENRPLLPPMEALKSIAIFRFINPDEPVKSL
jgi:biotin synthase